MNSQFCRVGKISPSDYIAYKLKNLEEEYFNFLEEAYSLMHVDQSISDILDFEASKIRKKILTLRKFI